MGKIRRRFDVQFKIQVCQSIEAGVQTTAEICRDNQLQKPVVEGWLKRYQAGVLQSKSGSREKELERENEKLKAKIGELTMTIDVLKKVEAWKQQYKSVSSSIVTSKNLAQYQKDAKPLAWPAPVTIINPKRTR